METRVDIEALIENARAAREHAYAPYSGFQVGAAVAAAGRVFTGANVENASYGLTVCAERVAVVNAVSQGARALDGVALVTTTSPPTPPCGMCLQTLAEFSADTATFFVTMANLSGERVTRTLAELLPHGFRKSDLPAKSR